MVVCLMAVIGIAALGFDLAYGRLARLELQNATDAATHAALVRLRTTADLASARDMAMTVAGRNTVFGRSLTLTTGDIVFGGWNYAHRQFYPGSSPANAVQVSGVRSATNANGAIPTTFGRALGVTGMSMDHVGVAAYRIRSIMVAQDITGSFTASIDAAGAADVAMLDQLHTFNLPADRIGMMLFTGDAQLFTPLQGLQTNYWTVRGQWYGDGRTVYDTHKTSGITVCNKLDLDPHYPNPYDHGWTTRCSAGGDGTNQGAAIRKAADNLLANAQAYETRVIVLITDGKPACCTGGSCSETNSCAITRAQYGRDMADYADDNEISIYTVSFGADAQQHAYNASLARGIGKAYNTPDKNQLASILIDIAGTIPISLVK